MALPSFPKQPLLRYWKYYMVYKECQNDVGYLKYYLIRQMFYTWAKQKYLQVTSLRSKISIRPQSFKCTSQQGVTNCTQWKEIWMTFDSGVILMRERYSIKIFRQYNSKEWKKTLYKLLKSSVQQKTLKKITQIYAAARRLSPFHERRNKQKSGGKKRETHSAKLLFKIINSTFTLQTLCAIQLKNIFSKGSKPRYCSSW